MISNSHGEAIKPEYRESYALHGIQALAYELKKCSSFQKQIIDALLEGFKAIQLYKPISFSKSSEEEYYDKYGMSEEETKVIEGYDKELSVLDKYQEARKTVLKEMWEDADALKAYIKKRQSPEFKAQANSIASEYGESLRKHTDKNLGKSIYSLFAKEFPIIQAITKKYATGPGGFNEQLQDERDSLKKQARNKYTALKDETMLSAQQNIDSPVVIEKPEGTIRQPGKPFPTRQDILNLPSIYGSPVLYLERVLTTRKKKSKEDEEEDIDEPQKPEKADDSGIFKELIKGLKWLWNKVPPEIREAIEKDILKKLLPKLGSKLATLVMASVTAEVPPLLAVIDIYTIVSAVVDIVSAFSSVIGAVIDMNDKKRILDAANDKEKAMYNNLLKIGESDKMALHIVDISSRRRTLRNLMLQTKDSAKRERFQSEIDTDFKPEEERGLLWGMRSDGSYYYRDADGIDTPFEFTDDLKDAFIKSRIDYLNGLNTAHGAWGEDEEYKSQIKANMEEKNASSVLAFVNKYNPSHVFVRGQRYDPETYKRLLRDHFSELFPAPGTVRPIFDTGGISAKTQTITVQQGELILTPQDIKTIDTALKIHTTTKKSPGFEPSDKLQEKAKIILNRAKEIKQFSNAL